MRFVVFAILLVLGCKEVDKLSDAAAAASAALREERRLGNELGETMEKVALANDVAGVETKILPALERYVAAIDLAIEKSTVVQQYEQDPKTESQLDVYRRRAAAYRAARDTLAALRGKPEEMARALPEVSKRLLAAP